MDQWRGKLAVVTGASSGIGASIVEALLQRGVNVAGLARRVENMKSLADRMKTAKGTFHPIACDLRKEQDVLAAFRTVEKLGGVDILVNNAGLAFVGKIVDSSTESMKNILDVNLLGVAICTREAVRSMKNRKVNGQILNINSILGHTPSESMEFCLNFYETSKCAITAMSGVLRKEMRLLQLPIKVSCVSPGLVKTDMPVLAEAGGAKIFESVPHLQIKDVVDAILYILGTPPTVQVRDMLITGLHG